jgi:hypothetical protein
MASYRIHRLKESQRAQFRLAPHVSGLSHAKPKDYLPAAEVEAAHPYAAWTSLRGTPDALEVGDILESPAGDLCILKYVGFEQARWVVPEPAAPAAVAASTEAGVGVAPEM